MKHKRPYSAYEIFYYNVKDNKIDFSTCYFTTVYARSENGAERKFKKIRPDTSIDIIEPKVELTYQDLYEMISMMTKKEKKQSFCLMDTEKNQEVYVTVPYYEDDKICFEVFMDFH